MHERELALLRAHPFTCPVRIAVLHHPISALPTAPEVARFSGLLKAGAVKEAMFAAKICLVLHGHQHSGWIAKETWPGKNGGRALHIAAAPTLGSRETQEHLGFNEIRLHREGEDRHELAVRKLIRQGEQWIAPIRPPVSRSNRKK